MGDRYCIRWGKGMYEFSEFKNDRDAYIYGTQNKLIISIENQKGEVIYTRESYLNSIKK